MVERAEQQALGLPSIQRVVTPDRLLLFLKALPAQPDAFIDPAKFVFGKRPYILKVSGSNPHGGPIRTLTHELPSIVPPGKIAIEITYQTNLNQFWQEVKRLEGKQVILFADISYTNLW